MLTTKKKTLLEKQYKGL